MDRTKNTKATLALGDSTVDEVFSSFADIERPGGTEKPTMHKIKLKITPQYQTTSENLEYDVQIVIKVIPTKMLYFVCYIWQVQVVRQPTYFLHRFILGRERA